jgi:5'-3' exonuclease
MGIKNLNKILRSKCKNSIKMISVDELFDKDIVVDISIYLYKFLSENALIENMYLMLSIFNYYKIKPLFVFDGKPPPEKKKILIQRIKDKKKAEIEYNNLKNQLTNSTISFEDKKEIITNMDVLKKRFIYIKKEEIDKVKELISSFGGSYIEALGEADEICAMLVIENKVWACLSEDSDMFVYGCPRILRYFSLLNHTIVLYDMKNILDELEISQTIFREICILSGTDYNNNFNKNTLYLENSLHLYKKFSDSKQDDDTDFYHWLYKNENCNINEYELLKKIYSIFDLSKNRINLYNFENITIVKGIRCNEKIHEILKEDGFIFPI